MHGIKKYLILLEQTSSHRAGLPVVVQSVADEILGGWGDPLTHLIIMKAGLASTTHSPDQDLDQEQRGCPLSSLVPGQDSKAVVNIDEVAGLGNKVDLRIWSESRGQTEVQGLIDLL